MERNHEIEDFKSLRRVPWNKVKLIGAKPPLRPSHVWSIRTKLQWQIESATWRFQSRHQ